jgi:hypothetical protein
VRVFSYSLEETPASEVRVVHPDTVGNAGYKSNSAAQLEKGMVMDAKIEVEKIDKSKFRVRVIESGIETIHDVTVSPNDYTSLTNGKVEPEELVRRSFEFLLEREPKESILTLFDLSVIGRYFPEYEREIKRRLS